jgi:hypothetical protein
LKRLLDHAGGRLLDLSERGEKGGRRREKGRKRRGEKREERSPPPLISSSPPSSSSLDLRAHLVLNIEKSAAAIFCCCAVFIGDKAAQEVVLSFHLFCNPKCTQGAKKTLY